MRKNRCRFRRCVNAVYRSSKNSSSDPGAQTSKSFRLKVAQKWNEAALASTFPRHSCPGSCTPGKPFAHEINPRFALVPDVGANIQKIMGRNRPQKQLANSPAKSWPHSTHRECNEADKGAPVIAIEIVGNATL